MRRVSTLAAFAVVVALGGSFAPGRWPALAQEATPTALRCPSPLASPVAAPAAIPGGVPACVSVREYEYNILAKRVTFRVGEPYVFAVGNEGAMAHEFVIESAASAEEDALLGRLAET